MAVDKDDKFLQNRIRDIANRSYKNNMYTFTNFLSMADAAAYYAIEDELRFVDKTVWGGAEDCERVMVRFGGEEQLGYVEEFPIAILHISAVMKKFSDELSHRDVLGSLMNLGIEREVLGDIYINNNEAYVFCLSSIAEYICDSLTRIKHTIVTCKVVDEMPQILSKPMTQKIIQVQSERIDGVISKVYNMSRSQTVPLFVEKKVFVNGRQCENNAYQLKPGDLVTVRGSGRFTYVETTGMSKKGKLNVLVEQ